MKILLAIFTFFAACQTTSLQARTFKTERWQTSNGARVVFHQAMEVPMLDINVAFAAGSAYDGEHFGLSALTTQLLDQGSGQLNATQIAERFADVGAQYSANTTRDMAVLQLKTLTNEEALKQAADTLALIINKPVFEQHAFNHQKNQQMVAITQTQESPGDVANQVFFNKLYGQHPYAHAINGTIKDVKQLKPELVRKFYRHYFTGNNAVIVMVGAINSDRAHQLAEQLLQELPKGNAAPAVPKAPPLTAEETVSINFPSSQTMIRLGQTGINHNVPDYFPLLVGNYILGGGALVSRLATEVREKRGLTYGVDSQFLPMPGEGPFLISLSTKNKQADNALKVTKDTLGNFLATGPSEEELTAAKQYLTGSFPLSMASNSNIAGILLRIAFYQLPDDYLDTYTAHIDGVTVADVKKAFEHQIHPDKMLKVSVGATQTTEKT